MSDEARPKAYGEKLSHEEVNRDLPVVLIAGEEISSTPVAVYVKSADGYAYKTTATPVGENIDFVGFVMEIAGGSGSAIAVQIKGLVSGFSGLDIGKKYYLSDVAGAVGTPIGTLEAQVGIAVSATKLLIMKGNFEYVGSAVISTSGSTPGTVIMPAIARIAVLDITFSATLYSSRGDIMIIRKGKTSGAAFDYGYTGSSVYGVSVTVSLSGNTITITVGATGAGNAASGSSGTVYFYK